LVLCVAVCTGGLSCRKASPPAIDPALASAVPAGTTILAGVDCQRLRAAPVYQKLPAGVTAFLEPLRDASYVVTASNGKDYVAIARGIFREAPAGATLLAPGLAVVGSPEAVRAAAAQHRSGTTGAPALAARAETLAAGSEIWIVADGHATLPLSGNAENVNRWLHAAEYATLVGRVNDGIRLDATGVCATADAARRLEETLRAFVSIGVAANARQPEMAARLRAIRIEREDRTVRASLAADAAGVEQWLRAF
jgi:hypothetical protein